MVSVQERVQDVQDERYSKDEHDRKRLVKAPRMPLTGLPRDFRGLPTSHVKGRLFRPISVALRAIPLFSR